MIITYRFLTRQLLVILNDNQMSISPNVGAMRNYLMKISTNKYYNYIRKKISTLPDIAYGKTLLRRIESSVKNFLLPRTVFEDLGFRYFGPVDGHDVNLLVNTLEKIKDLPGPVVLHTVTKKGKGIDYAEQDPIKYHGVKAKKIGEELGIPAISSDELEKLNT